MSESRVDALIETIRTAVIGDDEAMQGPFGLRKITCLDRRFGLSERIPAEQRPVVFVGPYEHHSNELPWRESACDVVVIPGDDSCCAPTGCRRSPAAARCPG